MMVEDDDEWTALHGKMAAQLTKFQAKGGDLPHMSSAAAWVNLYDKSTLEWWATWGVECPELQRFALKVVGLLIGSGPAERTWKDVDAILTKKRNRLHVQTTLDLVYVRTWLRRELRCISEDEFEVFKEWEQELLREATFYDGPTDVDADPDQAAAAAQNNRVFEDTIEDWELNAIDGKGPGPAIPLAQVRRNHVSKFRLSEKYKALYFVDKDPDGKYI